MGEERVFELTGLLSELDKEGGYFIDFLKIRDLEAGVLRLHFGEKDTQEPHSADELYYVIEGSGFIELGKTSSRPVKKGSIIFVPAKMHHRFYGNKDELVVLYMFAE